MAKCYFTRLYRPSVCTNVQQTTTLKLQPGLSDDLNRQVFVIHILSPYLLPSPMKRTSFQNHLYLSCTWYSLVYSVVESYYVAVSSPSFLRIHLEVLVHRQKSFPRLHSDLFQIPPSLPVNIADGQILFYNDRIDKASRWRMISGQAKDGCGGHLRVSGLRGRSPSSSAKLLSARLPEHI